MKPKAPSEHEDGLLEYLEDIIGTSQYKGPIDEALVEMERLTEDRTEKLNRLRLVERERNALEKEKREAENYLRLQNDHVRAQSTLYQYYIWRCLVSEKEVKQEIVGGLRSDTMGLISILSSRLTSKRNFLMNGSVIRTTSRIWSRSRNIMRNVFSL
jgi:chromosome segregation ATPase